MNACEDLAVTASAGAAPALRAIDCFANQTAASAFGRLFGAQGVLLPALTILLTLYIAFFAISLLTGRSRIGVSALTPRMITLGLVLTFATSWVAYQGVVWNLTIGAADQLAGILTGTKGSATQLFADKLDIVFAAIAEAADQASAGGQAAGNAPAAGGGSGTFTPANLMWIAALILLLGTVGLLVTARIALAILLAVGPVFVVLALFSGTRGLFVGWLRGLIMTALTPLFVVVGGGMMLELMVPLIANLTDGLTINGQAAIGLFLVACVNVALMAMILKVTGAMVAGWQVFGLAGAHAAESGSRSQSQAVSQVPALPAGAMQAGTATSEARRAAVVVPTDASTAPPASAPAASVRETRKVVVSPAAGGPASLPPLPAQRARGVGSRFRARPSTIREMKA